MPERLTPATDEPIRNISSARGGRSLSKRKNQGSPAPVSEAPATAEDIRARIEQLAYALYQQRGQEDGYDCQDWLEAERMVQASSSTPQNKDGSGATGSSALHRA